MWFASWFASVNNIDGVITNILLIGIAVLFLTPRIVVGILLTLIRDYVALIIELITHPIRFFKSLWHNKKLYYKRHLFDLISDSVELIMQIIITLALLSISLYVIITPQKFDDGTRNWAFGAVGSVIGYWFPKRKR
jgi:hypothetical protein